MIDICFPHPPNRVQNGSTKDQVIVLLPVLVKSWCHWSFDAQTLLWGGSKVGFEAKVLPKTNRQISNGSVNNLLCRAQHTQQGRLLTEDAGYKTSAKALVVSGDDYLRADRWLIFLSSQGCVMGLLLMWLPCCFPKPWKQEENTDFSILPRWVGYCWEC